MLIDFGSARFESGQATSTQVTFYTPPYAAHRTVREDLSAGAVDGHLCAGRRALPVRDRREAGRCAGADARRPRRAALGAREAGFQPHLHPRGRRGDGAPPVRASAVDAGMAEDVRAGLRHDVRRANADQRQRADAAREGGAGRSRTGGRGRAGCDCRGRSETPAAADVGTPAEPPKRRSPLGPCWPAQRSCCSPPAPAGRAICTCRRITTARFWPRRAKPRQRRLRRPPPP